ncbi:MAG: DUF1559 domain-containing protein [Planctomycetia bacterium]|nr:DUF1559 domain-containing protein [Planctomycetia bacterium]
MTLVELLVVFAVIAALAAIIAPAVQSAREAARRAYFQRNVRQIAFGVDAFQDAHGTYPSGQFGSSFGWGPNSRAWSFSCLSSNTARFIAPAGSPTRH